MLSLLSLLVAPAAAEMRADKVAWSTGGVIFNGWVVYDDATSTPRPGLVMVPNWMGVTDAAVAKAKAIAGDDYVVLVTDVYGKDVRPKNTEEARAAAGAMYADRATLRARAQAGVSTLRAQAGRVPLDATRIGAIGFCFGGSTVLELARSGVELGGVVSFHGGLSTPTPATTLPTPVLVLHGAADPTVPAADLAAFQAEMTQAGADWQLVSYGGATHCFTETDAQSPPVCAFDARTADRAFAAMRGFFDERFGR